MAQIDELIVKVKGDVSDLKRKLGTAAKSSKTTFGKIKKHIQSISAPFKGAISNVNKFGGAIGLAAVAGVAVMAKKSLDSADALAKLSGQLGIGAEFLQEFRFAASQTGLAQNELDNSLKIFTKNIGEANSGNKTFADSFKRLGVDIQDSNGKLKSTEVLIKEVADGMVGLPTDTERASAAFELFGRAGIKLTNTFKKGSSGIEKYQKEARDLGIVINADLLKGAEEANDKFDILSRVISTQVVTAFVAFAPHLVDITTSLIEASQGAIQFAKDIGLIDERDPKKKIDGIKVSIIDLEQELIKLEKGSTHARTGVSFIDHSAIKRAKSEIASLTEDLKKLEGDKAEKKKVEGAPPEIKSEEEKQKAISDMQKRGEEERSTFAASEREKEKEAKQQVITDEISQLEERNELLAEVDSVKHENEIEQNQEKIKTLTQQVAEGSTARLEIEANRIRKERELMDQGLTDAASTFSNLMSLSKGQNRQLFEISKVAATATAVVQGGLAVQKAFASAPPPFSFIAAAAAATTAAVNVSKIQGVGFNKGIDSVPGVGNTDSVNAFLTPGERVVPKETNKDLTAALKNGMGKNITINNYNTFAGLTFDDDDVKLQLVEVINTTTRELGAKLI